MDSHWSDDELVALAYGAAPRREDHVTACRACAARFERIERRRRELAAVEPAIPESFLLDERRAIHGRLASPRAAFSYSAQLIPSLVAILCSWWVLDGVRSDDENAGEAGSLGREALEDVFTLRPIRAAGDGAGSVALRGRRDSIVCW